MTIEGAQTQFFSHFPYTLETLIPTAEKKSTVVLYKSLAEKKGKKGFARGSQQNDKLRASLLKKGYYNLQLQNSLTTLTWTKSKRRRREQEQKFGISFWQQSYILIILISQIFLVLFGEKGIVIRISYSPIFWGFFSFSLISVPKLPQKRLCRKLGRFPNCQRITLITEQKSWVGRGEDWMEGDDGGTDKKSTVAKNI